MNKLLFWVLASAAVLLLGAVVYALIYAPPGSIWKKDRGCCRTRSRAGG